MCRTASIHGLIVGGTVVCSIAITAGTPPAYQAVSAEGGGWQVLLLHEREGRELKDALVSAARELCAKQDPCVVSFWRDGANFPKGATPSGREFAAMVAQARFAGLYGELTVDGQEELPVTFDRLGAGGWTQVSSIPYPEPDQAEYNAYLVPGDAEITGQAFLMTRGGEVRRCSGQDVFLDPVTTYSRIWYENAGSTSLQAIPSATVFQKVRMVTKCDADGRFRFKGVPAGRYYLRTQVRWEAPTRYGLEPQGGLVGTEIEVRSGASGEVILGDDALLAPVAF